MAFALLARLAGRVRGLVERLDGVAARSVESRLAAYLLVRHREAEGGPFTLGATQAEVAEELGTVREVVVRGLGALGRRGVLRSAGRGRWEVADEGALRAGGGGGTERRLTPGRGSCSIPSGSTD
ncbi:MAG TPA: helix-turn-helix domain-containing protein [Longimicrobiaceae bacterium]|nr:helix-turn-helix domain-containing protein [Longimicrobiaceae bacterium]